MKNKLAKYQNEYINFLVEVIFLLFFVKDKKLKDNINRSLTTRSTHFLALKNIPLLLFIRRRINSSKKSKELIF